MIRKKLSGNARSHFGSSEDGLNPSFENSEGAYRGSYGGDYDSSSAGINASEDVSNSSGSSSFGHAGGESPAESDFGHDSGSAFSGGGYGNNGGYNGGNYSGGGYGGGGYNGGNYGGGYGNNDRYGGGYGNGGYNNGGYGNGGYNNGGYNRGYNNNGSYGYRPRMNNRPRINKMRTSNDPILAADPFKGPNGEDLPEVQISGILELHPNGYGFLRDPAVTYTRQLIDPFVPGNMIEHYGLREGVFCTGTMTPGRKNQGPRLKEMLSVEGNDPEKYAEVRPFDELTAITPEHWYKLETGQEPVSTRVMDLLTPLGRGQRALIVAPPRTGKTILMQQISRAISQNYPDTKLFMLLIDERPEEVTDMRRAVNGEVVASSLDRDIESHVRLSQLIIERCKRLAEMGQDVFLLLDSITRLARAFNKWVGNTGRTMSGGVDIKAMDIPKKLFATARQFEEGGSLTIVGTALIDTGSRMDELIFQEFKGTGNMELVLDRKLADRRIWPAMDISQSGTRREEKLLEPETLHAVTLLRRTLANMNPIDAMEQLTQKLGKRKTNQEFIDLISGAHRE